MGCCVVGWLFHLTWHTFGHLGLRLADSATLSQLQAFASWGD